MKNFKNSLLTILAIFAPYFMVMIAWCLSFGSFDYQATVTNEYFYLLLVFWQAIGLPLAIAVWQDED